jgi:hypothetical protein
VSNHGVESGLLVKISLVLIAAMISAQAAIAQPSEANRGIAPPGLKEIQVPFASHKPEAIFKIGENADWVQVTDDAVWVASSKPASVHGIDRKTNNEVAVIPPPGDPCAGLAFGFGSLWYHCADDPTRLRVSTQMQTGSGLFFPLDRRDRKAESRPALTASGSSAMIPALSPASILLPTRSGREFPSRRVLIIHASVKTLCGLPAALQIC